MKLKDITYTALFISLTIVGSWISIPIGPVPITLQLLFVLLSGLILGARLGFLSQVVYLIIGAIGLPVFANFKGGIVHIYGPTGGYLLAFPIASLIVGWISKKKNGFINNLIASLVGIIIIYLFGFLRLGIFLKDFKKAFFVGVVPFIAIDLAKAFIAAFIAKRILKARTEH